MFSVSVTKKNMNFFQQQKHTNMQCLHALPELGTETCTLVELEALNHLLNLSAA